MSNDYYERKAELEPFTTARSDDVRNELDAVQSAFEKLAKPRQDGTKGFLTPFTVVTPTNPSEPATHAQVTAEKDKNTEQDARLDNVENALTGLGPVDGRFTTLRYVASEGQTQIVLPAQFQSLAYVHKNGARLYQTVGFDYDVALKTITFANSLSLSDEVLVDVGMVPDAVLADLIAIQNDIADRQSDVITRQADVTTKNNNVNTKHGEVEAWQLQVSQDKDTTVAAKDEANETYALLQKRHLGSHATAPTTDNDGNPLIEGAGYYNNVDGKSYIYEQGQWAVTNLSALTTVAKDSPTGKAFMPVGTSAQGGTPDKGAVRYDDEAEEYVGGNGVEWGGLGGGGVPKFILKTANFTVAKKKAYELDMSDDISKTALVPVGMPNNTWFAVSVIGSTGADGVYVTIDTQTETWNYDDGKHNGYKFPANSNATYYFRKNTQGKWVIADGIGEGSEFIDAPSDNSRYVRRNGRWVEAAPNPNLLINPDFSVWQRGTVWTDDNYSCVDRWGTNLVTAGNKGKIREGDFFYIANTTAYHLWQRIEKNPSDLAGKYASVSINTMFDEGCSVTVQARYKDSSGYNVLIEDVGTISVPTHIGAPVWSYLTFKFPDYPTWTDGDFIELRFIVNATAPTRWFDCKLEESEFPTKYVAPDTVTNKAACQRYCVRFGTSDAQAIWMHPINTNSAGTQYRRCNIFFPSSLRRTPGVDDITWKTDTVAAVGVQYSHVNHLSLQCTAASSGVNVRLWDVIVDVEL